MVVVEERQWWWEDWLRRPRRAGGRASGSSRSRRRCEQTSTRLASHEPANQRRRGSVSMNWPELCARRNPSTVAAPEPGSDVRRRCPARCLSPPRHTTQSAHGSGAECGLGPVGHCFTGTDPGTRPGGRHPARGDSLSTQSTAAGRVRLRHFDGGTQPNLPVLPACPIRQRGGSRRSPSGPARVR